MTASSQPTLRLISTNDLTAIANLSFSDAASVWFAFHIRHILPGTRRHYKLCIAVLERFLGSLPLREIGIGHFEQYQRLRSTGGAGFRKAGPSSINHELNTLSQILNHAGLWARIEPHYRPLPLPRSKVGLPLTREEESRLFSVAASKPRWKVAYYCALLTANTLASPSEIRHLRLQDVDFDPPAIRAQGRIIPLNETAVCAANALLKRAKENGAINPWHYLLPHRAGNAMQGFDPTHPMTSWRGSWDALRRAAGLPELRINELSRTRSKHPGRVSRGSQIMTDRWSKLKAKLADATRPDDWNEKPIEWRIIGNELLSRPSMSNAEVGASLDGSRIISCPYGNSWKAAMSQKACSEFLRKIRAWVKKPGKGTFA